MEDAEDTGGAAVVHQAGDAQEVEPVLSGRILICKVPHKATRCVPGSLPQIGP